MRKSPSDSANRKKQTQFGKRKPGIEGLSPRELLEIGVSQLGIRLPEGGIDHLIRYLAELMRWNKKINLTALHAMEDIVVKHFIDSLTALPFLKTTQDARWMDVGTGGGFPGLVLKIALPEIALTLIEPSGKKTTFLHHLIGLFGMRYVSVIQERIENLDGSQWKLSHDLVMTRALSPDLLLEKGQALVRKGGEILIFQGHADRILWKKRIAKYPGLHLKKIAPVSLPLSEAERRLVFVQKN